MSIMPDQLDLSSAPRIRPGTAAVTVGPETVLLGEFGRAHVLNPTASLVWQFLDGEVTLRQLANDFVAALEGDRSTVEGELLEFTRTLGSLDLLEGVAQPIDAAAFDPAWAPIEPVAVGEEIEGLTLAHLDGRPVSLEAWRGRRVLMVNWNPSCGFCVQIAPELAAAEEPLTRAGVDLLFLTSGTQEENREVFRDAGLTAAAVVEDGEQGVFVGVGTPSAYLLDAEGRVEAPLAIGAVEVPRLVTGLLDRRDGATVAAEAPEPPGQSRYLPAPMAVCGPGSSGGTSGTGDWIGTRAYRLGEVHVGIRYNTEATAELLDRLLADSRVEDPQVPDNYSVALQGVVGGGARKFNLLLRGGTPLVRSRSPGRVLAALLAHLGADTYGWPQDDGLLPVAVTAGIRGGEAVLLPDDLVGWLPQLEPRLARRAIAVVDGPVTFIDPDTFELVVPEPTVPFVESVLVEVDDSVHLGREQPAVRPGRYPLTDWYFASAEDTVGRWSPAQAVAAAYRLVAGVDAPTVLGQRLAGVFSRVRATGIWMSSLDGFVDQLSGPTA